MSLIKGVLSSRSSIYSKINTLATFSEKIATKSGLIKMQNLNQEDRLIKGCTHIYNDIPVRFSNNIKKLERFPFNIEKHCGVAMTRDWYVQSLEDISASEYPNTYEKALDFLTVTEKIVDRHSPTLKTMARAINELKKTDTENEDINDSFALNHFLNGFFGKRTRTRLLLQNLLAYAHPDKKNHVGLINLKTDITKVIEDTIHDVELVSLQNFMDFPNINIHIDDMKFTYVDSYLHYVLFEILKNSVKAIHDANPDCPEISITSHRDENMYILKIRDNGTGIIEYDLDKIWDFGHSTSKIDMNDDSIFTDKNSPISGFGYGLSISRIILKTFGDYVKLFSEYRKGTDVYIMIDLKNDWVL